MMINVACQVRERHFPPAFKVLENLKTKRGDRFAYVNYFQANTQFIHRIRVSITGTLGHSEFQDIQGRLGLNK